MEQGEIDVLLELGQSYLLHKEYDNAIKKFGEAIRINPHDPELYYHLGLAYEGANKIAQAVDVYKKALQLNSNFNEAQIRLNEIENKKPEP